MALFGLNGKCENICGIETGSPGEVTPDADVLILVFNGKFGNWTFRWNTNYVMDGLKNMKI